MWRHRFIALSCGVGLVVAATWTVAPPVSAARTVTITAKLTGPYRLLALARSGRAYIADAKSGKVAISGLSPSETKAMTLSVLNTSGAYVGPVMLKYLTTKKKTTTKPSAAATGYIMMRSVSGTKLDLGTIKVSTNFAYVTKAPPVSGLAVGVVKGVPPARNGLGLGTTVQSKGVRAMADPTENLPGDDPDRDGIPSAVDVDDDNDAVLDLQDSTFYKKDQPANGPQLGDAMMTTALVCGGRCVNLNAFGITSPEQNPAVQTALSQMINEWQGVIFRYVTNAVKKNFTLPSALTAFGMFNVDCTGITWCSGPSAQAAMVIPHYPSSMADPNKTLPVTDFNVMCGSKVIAPTISQGFGGIIRHNKPANWPAGFAWNSESEATTNYLFATCDPDGDGFPNVIPGSGTLATGQDWENEIKPRMPGPDGLKVGDTVKFKISKSDGTVLNSSVQVISAVIQTTPNVMSWEQTVLDYAKNPSPILAEMRNPSGSSVTFTFWRPQRLPVGSKESTWMDVGQLIYSFIGPGGSCPFTAASSTNGTQPRIFGGKLIDTANDEQPNSANFLTATVDVSTCRTSNGSQGISQFRLMAGDRSGNTTNFNWSTTNSGP